MRPDNAVYFHAAYVVVAAAYLAYAVSLARRRARVRRQLHDAG